MILIAGVLSGCSGSSDSASSEAQSAEAPPITMPVDGSNQIVDDANVSEIGSENNAQNGDTASGNTDNINDDTTVDGSNVNDEQLQSTQSETEQLTTTQVNFNITVPAYKSNALQVQIEWGDTNLLGVWNADELWTASAELPSDTQSRLRISFNDRNGGITLGRFEEDFKTGLGNSEVFEVTSDQFNTAAWDDDKDGVSNLDELIANTNPDGEELPQPVQATLEAAPIKTLRVTWNATTNASFYRVLENPDGVSGFTDISGELDSNTTAFNHYVSLFSRVNAQYMVQSCNAQGCSDSTAVLVSGSLDKAIGYFKGTSDSFEQFGYAVSLSENGTTLAVGASDDRSAYVFALRNGRWLQQAHLDVAANGFGNAVSLSADGNTLAVGARYEHSAATGINGDQTDDSAKSSGAVFVYVTSDDAWQQQAYIKASNTGSEEGFGGDYFGGSVSLSADGSTLAVGADKEQSATTGIYGDQSNNSVWGAGAVYVFVRNDDNWAQQAYLKASNTGEFDHFGRSVKLSANGNTLAVGAPLEDSNATGINGDQSNNLAENSGAVYIFVRDNELWEQQAYIKASNTSARDSFGGDEYSNNTVRSGEGISLSADGNTLAVGARAQAGVATDINGSPNENAALINGGAVYVFVRTGERWQQQSYIKASNAQGSDWFGQSVSLSSDGETLAVGASREDSIATGLNGDQNNSEISNFDYDAGAAYLFILIDGNWQQKGYIKASNTGFSDKFGQVVSLSGDGKTLAVGAPDERSVTTGINGDQSDNSQTFKGAVYLY